MRLLQKILFATDFSKSARDALATTIRIAETFNSQVLLLHVIPEMKDYPLALDLVQKEAHKRLQKVAKELEAKNIAVAEQIIVVGSPFDQIISHADEHEVNLIVIGAGDKTTRDKFRLGTTAFRVMRKASRPVWVVKRKASPEITSILCPVDFSESSRRALRNAIHLARGFEAELTVLTVIQRLSGFYPAMARLAADEQAAFAKKQEERLEEFLHEFDLHQVKWSKEVRQGKPPEAILAMARELTPQLLVMGSTGRTGLPRILMGSVAEKVTRELPCSVVTVKSEHAIQIQLEAELAEMESHCELAHELLKKGFTDEATGQFKTCIDKDMLFAPAWEGLAAAYRRMGREEEAEEAEQKAKRIREHLWGRKVEGEVRRDLWGKKR